ncbi:cation:proton antiporter domain-containing protein [Thiohalorhabdus sp.]|uniref:cation:proton antiporter domain-containing protein n=1 Tax=Thiohalorhabdus sp. TaxID=3094134 RepID=UPI002FC37FC8
MHEPVLFALFLIFVGAALAATGALYARQSLLVGYILLGILLGPSALGWVGSPDLIKEAASLGVIFLLFLLGLNLHPQKLVQLFSAVTLTTLGSSALFAAFGFAVAWGFGFTLAESLVVGAASMFSSTIIGLKLLPATALHHQHIGEIVIGVLLLQDLLAIVTLIALQGLGTDAAGPQAMGWLLVGLPVLIAVAFGAERYLLRPLWRRFDRVQEYVFLTAIAWCLGVAELGKTMGLSYEIGAFLAGVAVANSPIARFIAESLRPLRDFFLVLYFFALGAGLDLFVLGDVLIPGLVLAGGLLVLKPLAFRGFLGLVREQRPLASEVGWRLGQMSEFALFVALVAVEGGVIGERASYLLQFATVVTFIVSSYAIGLRYPSPIAGTAALRQD